MALTHTANCGDGYVVDAARAQLSEKQSLRGLPKQKQTRSPTLTHPARCSDDCDAHAELHVSKKQSLGGLPKQKQTRSLTLTRPACGSDGCDYGSASMVSGATPAPECPFSVEEMLLSSPRHVYNVRRAPDHITRALVKQAGACSHVNASVRLRYQTIAQIRRDLRSNLAESLASHRHEFAFDKQFAFDDRPRADELEKLVASFPTLHTVDWDAPPVDFGINCDLWKVYHARHCTKCTPSGRYTPRLLLRIDTSLASSAPGLGHLRRSWPRRLCACLYVHMSTSGRRNELAVMSLLKSGLMSPRDSCQSARFSTRAYFHRYFQWFVKRTHGGS